jgi:integrase
VDVSEGTRTQQRTSLNRALRILGDRRLDELSAHDVAAMVGELHGEGLRPSFIRKIVQATAMVLDHAGLSPNPARDKVIVKLPREEPEEINPPSAEHVEAVYRLLPSKHRLALLWLDWSGARVSSIDSTLVGDYDESRRRVRLRATTKTRRALWVELHPVLADRLEATLGPREDRDPEARLFADSGADALRTSIAKACKAAAIPTFSPHDLRHRRISLMHLRGVPWARICEFVGRRNLAVTANTYSHVLVDEAEVEYAALPAPR